MWLVYALGGGWGHVTRAASLARAAAPQHRVRILSNSTFAPVVREGLAEAEVLAIDPRTPAGEVRSIALREIAGGISRLIVDTFPRGIGGELADVLEGLRVPKVLVHRDLNPRYVRAANLREFVRRNYDLILVPGEGEGEAFGDLPEAEETAPWLIRSSDEVQCGYPPYVLVCAAGRRDEADWYAAVSRRLEADGMAVRQAAGAWPAMDLIAGAAAVVGGGGYNTVHECLALQVPLVARAWPRQYDRQDLRLERASRRGTVVPLERPEEACAAVREVLPRTPRAPHPIPYFANGARAAAALVGKSVAAAK